MNNRYMISAGTLVYTMLMTIEDVVQYMEGMDTMDRHFARITDFQTKKSTFGCDLWWHIRTGSALNWR